MTTLAVSLADDARHDKAVQIVGLGRRRAGTVQTVRTHRRQTVASVAQLVEQLTLNQLVVGSNPPRGTILQFNSRQKEITPGIYEKFISPNQ
jgi:hypothetical protein